MIRVLITGCGLAINEGLHRWGDLWEVGDCYVFNACGPSEGLKQSFGENVKQLCIVDASYENYFERRGVYVVAKREAQFNKAAEDYVARSVQ